MSIKPLIKNIFLATTVLLFCALISFFYLIPAIKIYNFKNYLDKIEIEGSTLVLKAKYENSEKPLIEYNSQKRIHPGSNFKLFTAAAALHYLGPEFKFSTKLFFDEKTGNLTLVGSGDPTFRQKDFKNFVEKIKESKINIKTISYDDSAFHGEEYGPDWPKAWENLYFGVPITGLQIDDNLLTIIGYENEETKKFEIQTFPLKNYPLIDNRTILKDINEIEIPTTARIENETIILEGETIKELPFHTSAVIKDPSKTTALVLKNQLGIEVPVQSIQSKNYGKLLYEHKSQSLKEIIATMLTFSKNNYAETLVRVLGEGSQADGVLVLEDFFLEIGLENISAFDGSGLSPNTRITANSIIKLFEYIEKQSWKDLFWHALPESRIDGTLKHRFSEVNMTNQVIAKTGSHSFSSSLSGKIADPSNKNILFSIHIYNYPYSTEESIAKIIPLIDILVSKLDQQW